MFVPLMLMLLPLRVEMVSSSCLSELVPDSYLSERMPGSYLSERVPDSYLSERVPDSYLSERVPGSYLSGRVPGSYLSEHVPDSYLSEQVPGSYLSERVPGSYLSERMPGSYLSERVSVCSFLRHCLMVCRIEHRSSALGPLYRVFSLSVRPLHDLRSLPRLIALVVLPSTRHVSPLRCRQSASLRLLRR